MMYSIFGFCISIMDNYALIMNLFCLEIWHCSEIFCLKLFTLATYCINLYKDCNGNCYGCIICISLDQTFILILINIESETHDKQPIKTV